MLFRPQWKVSSPRCELWLEELKPFAGTCLPVCVCACVRVCVCMHECVRVSTIVASQSSGYEVTTLDDYASRAHLFITATGCCDIIKPEHLQQMREDAIVCNIGHFDCEIDSTWLKANCQKSEIKPQVSRLLRQHSPYL